MTNSLLLKMAQSKFREFSHEIHGDVPSFFVSLPEAISIFSISQDLPSLNFSSTTGSRTSVPNSFESVLVIGGDVPAQTLGQEIGTSAEGLQWMIWVGDIPRPRLPRPTESTDLLPWQVVTTCFGASWLGDEKHGNFLRFINSMVSDFMIIFT